MANTYVTVYKNLKDQQGVSNALPDQTLEFQATTAAATAVTVTLTSTKGVVEISASTSVLYKHGAGITGAGNADGHILSGASKVTGKYSGLTKISFITG